jgi:hypothetical protein
MEYGIDEQSRKRRWKRYKKKLCGGLTNFSSNVFSKGDVLLENGYPGIICKVLDHRIYRSSWCHLSNVSTGMHYVQCECAPIMRIAVRSKGLNN